MNTKVKRYNVTKHAAERAMQRLGCKTPAEASRYLNDLMQTAIMQGHTMDDCYAYDHHKSRTRLIFDDSKQAVVTVYNMKEAIAPVAGVQPIALPAELLTELKRKAGAFLRKYMRRNRELERAIIEAKIAVLENERKKLRVNNPATKAVIDVKISDIQTQLDAMKAEQRELASKIAEVSAHA